MLEDPFTMLDDPKVLELINAGVDGELSPSDQKRFEDLRANQPEVDQYCDEIESTAVLVKSIKIVDPPTDLKAKIMASLPAPAVTRPEAAIPLSPQIGGFIETIRSLFLPQPALRYAMVFAGGLFVGGILMFVVPKFDAVNPTNAVGTVGSVVSDQAEITSEHFQATVRTTRVGESIELHLNGTANEPSDVRVQFSSTQIGLRAFSDKTDSNGVLQAITVEPGTVSIRFNGSGDLSLTFDALDAEPTRFVVEVRDADTIVVQEELTI